MSLNMQLGSLAVNTSRAFCGIPLMALLCNGAQEVIDDYVSVRLRFDVTDNHGNGGNRDYLKRGVDKRTVAKILRAELSGGSKAPLIDDGLIQRHREYPNDFVINFRRRHYDPYGDKMLEKLERNKFAKRNGEYRSYAISAMFGQGTHQGNKGYLNYYFSPVIGDQYGQYEKIPNHLRKPQDFVAQLENLQVHKQYRLRQMSDEELAQEQLAADLAERFQSTLDPKDEELSSVTMAAEMHPTQDVSQLHKRHPLRVKAEAALASAAPKKEAERVPLTELSLRNLAKLDYEVTKLRKVTFIVMTTDDRMYHCLRISGPLVKQRKDTVSKGKPKRFRIVKGKFSEPIYVSPQERDDAVKIPEDHDVFMVTQL